MIITALPVPPTRTDPLNFSTRAGTFLSALADPFVPELNALQLDITSKENSVALKTVEVSNLTTLNQGLLNFKGNWASLTGALSIPASVYHAGKYWVLLNNLTDVTTATPGVSSSWVSQVVAPTSNLIDNANFIIGNKWTNVVGTLAVGTFIRDRWKVTAGAPTVSGTLSGTLGINGSGTQIMQTIMGEEIRETGTYTLSWSATAGTQARINGGAWQSSSPFSVNLTAWSNATIEFKTNNAITSFTWVQLEKGVFATPFVPRNLVEDMDRCAYHRQVFVSTDTSPCYYTSFGVSFSTVVVDLSIKFIRQMYTTPTVTLVGTHKIYDSTTNVTMGNITTTAATPMSCLITVNQTGAPVVANRPCTARAEPGGSYLVLSTGY